MPLSTKPEEKIDRKEIEQKDALELAIDESSEEALKILSKRFGKPGLDYDLY